jgi:hypothetical protein
MASATHEAMVRRMRPAGVRDPDGPFCPTTYDSLDAFTSHPLDIDQYAQGAGFRNAPERCRTEPWQCLHSAKAFPFVKPC